MKKTIGKTIQQETVRTLRKGLAKVGKILNATFLAGPETTNQSKNNAQQYPNGNPGQAVLRTSKVRVPECK